jgi:hypothetical protein
VLQSILTGGTVWLEGVAIIELAMTIWALACVASALVERSQDLPRAHRAPLR